jgi:hypothetical protein
MKFRLTPSLLVTLGMLAAPEAYAETLAGASASLVQASDAAGSATAMSALGAALDPLAMKAQRGADGSSAHTTTTQNLTASTRDNSITADTVQSGDVSLSDGAFSGFNGIGNFVVNTGANNTLQGNLSVTIVTTP